MRITGGVLRSRTLVAPRGMEVRPTTDRVREALFSILLSELGSLEGLGALDLFAGTGSLGLEAVSRGAARVTFVEKDRDALRALGENAALAAGLAKVALLSDDALRPKTLRALVGPFDLVFVDPPYRLYDDPEMFARLREVLSALPLSPQALLVIEHGKKQAPELPGYEEIGRRSYGDTRLLLLRIAHEGAA